MLKSEFVERTGMKISDTEYADVEQVYMNTNLTKDEFCKDWKKHSESAIIDELNAKLMAEKWHRTEDEVRMQAQLEEANEKIARLEEIGVKGYERGEVDYVELTKLIGEKHYMEIKLRQGMQLDEQDRMILLKILETSK